MRYQKRYENYNPAPVIPVTVIESLTGCTSSTTGKTFVYGETISLVMYSDSGKYFENDDSVIIRLDGNDYEGMVMYLENRTKLVATPMLNCSTLEIIATAIDITVNLSVNAEHIAPCEFGGISSGDKLNSTYEAFTITPEEGYIIVGVPTIKVGENTIEATVAEGGTSASFAGGTLSNENVVITVETEVVVQPEEPSIVKEVEEDVQEVVKKPRRKTPAKKQEV